jgi:hypothetical protein
MNGNNYGVNNANKAVTRDSFGGGADNNYEKMYKEFEKEAMGTMPIDL